MNVTQRKQLLAQFSAMPITRMRYFPAAEAALVDQMGTGILFVIAWWSGRAIENFRELTMIVGILDPECQLEFVVVDADGADKLQTIPEFYGRLHGWGEAAWIHKGQIVAGSGVESTSSCFEPNTRTLLTAMERDRTGTCRDRLSP